MKLTMKLHAIFLFQALVIGGAFAPAQNNIDSRLGEIEASLSGLSISYKVEELPLSSAFAASRDKILGAEVVQPSSKSLRKLLVESIAFSALDSPMQYSCTSQVMGAEYRHDYHTQDGKINWSQLGDGRTHLSVDNVQSRASLHDKPKSAVLNFHALFNVSNFWRSESLRYPATMPNREYLEKNVAGVSVSPSSTKDANSCLQLSVHQSVPKGTSNQLYQNTVVQFNRGKDGLIQSIRHNIGDSITKEEITIRTIKCGDYREFPACKIPIPKKIEVVELFTVPASQDISAKAERGEVELLPYIIKRRISTVSLLDVKHIDTILADVVLPTGMLFMDTLTETSQKLLSPIKPFSK